VLSLRELERAVGLLAQAFIGARVQRVQAAGDRAVVLELHRRDGGGSGCVLLSTEAGRGRLCVLEARPGTVAPASGFVELVRARLRGAVLAAVELPEADRLAFLRFATSADRFTLVLALVGARSNLYLLDAEDCVVGSLRSLDETRRDLAGGRPWVAPAGAPASPGEDRFAAIPDADWFAAVEAHYASRGDEDERAALVRLLERAFRKSRTALAKKRALLEEDARGFGEAESLRRRGELLKGALSQVRAGQREVRVRDYESGGEEVLELDPKRPPHEQLTDLFQRARKAERRAARAASGLAELEAREAALSDLEGRLAVLTAPAAELMALRAFAEEPAVAKLVGRFAPTRSRGRATGAPAGTVPRRSPFVVGKRELPRRLWPRRYRSSSGLEIWVGRSDEGNDVLSTRLARGNDLFLHLDASPGSHVLLRTEGRSDAPPEALLEACELAVHFSRHRDAGRVEVLVAPAKGVRKPKGAKPGLVWVTGGRSLTLRRDARRLERVLAARIED